MITFVRGRLAALTAGVAAPVAVAMLLVACGGSTRAGSPPGSSQPTSMTPSATQPTSTTPGAIQPTSTTPGATQPTSTKPSGRTSSPSPSSSSSPGRAPTIAAGHPAWVAVSVATLWRSASSPRAVDEPALRSPADIRGWLGAMTLGDRRGLQGRADTQALLGDRLLVTAVRGSWGHVVAPDQPTPLDVRGYPGWVPLRQLSATAPSPRAEVATVVAGTAWLRTDTSAAGRLVEVSYGTQLPVLGRAGAWLRLAMPGGWVARVDPSVVVRHGAGTRSQPGTGSALVRSAQSFTGLPYLWAGRSGFGFDCSGLTSLVYRVHGVVIPRDADAQARAGRRVASSAAAPGDLFFYATASGYVHHVSMYAGSGQMVQSPATGSTVQTISVATPSYAAEFATARRYLG